MVWFFMWMIEGRWELVLAVFYFIMRMWILTTTFLT